jgi:hypothetical protein
LPSLKYAGQEEGISLEIFCKENDGHVWHLFLKMEQLEKIVSPI